MNKKVNEKRLETRASERSRHAIESEKTPEHANKRQKIDETDQGIYLICIVKYLVYYLIFILLFISF
jgi:hypothetical protein